MKESVLLYTLGVFGLDFKIRLLYKFSSGIIFILQTRSGWWNSQVRAALHIDCKQLSRWLLKVSLHLHAWSCLSQFLVWDALLKFLLPKKSPTVRAAFASTMVVTARGTWDLSAGTGLRVLPGCQRPALYKKKKCQRETFFSMS